MEQRAIAKKQDFRRFARAKNWARSKIRRRGGGGEGPPPFSYFLLSPHFSHRQNAENPVSSLFAPRKHLLRRLPDHMIKAPFTRVQTNRCTDKNLHSSTLRLHRTGGTGRIFERLSVQVWDLKKAGQLFDRHGSIFVRTRVNTQTVQRFAQIVRLWPGIKCRKWSNLCTDPCKHHRNRICMDPCKQAVQEQNSSVQKFVRTRVNGAQMFNFLSTTSYLWDWWEVYFCTLETHHRIFFGQIP